MVQGRARGQSMVGEARQGRERVRFHRYYDFSLLFLTVFLVCFGLVMIYSTSSYTAQTRFGDATFFLRKQGIAVLLGVVAMLVISRLDYKLLLMKLPVIRLRPVTLLYLLALALQTAVLFVGEDIYGAKRWIELPIVGSFQPAELSKVATIGFVSFVVYQAPRKMDKLTGFLRAAIYIAPLILLIAKENLSSAIIVAGVFVAICFVSSRKKLYFVVIFLCLVAAALAYVFLGEGFRAERIDIWLNVETHPKGYQILQGLYAIASGGLFGTGLGQSMQKLGFIPESHNDMIFTIICEEMGLVGAIAVIILFLLLIWRIFVIAVNAPDLYGALLCVGVLAQIAIQVILNIAVVTNTIPSTGISLPFISYGGTSVAILLMEIGAVLSVSNRIQYER